MPDGDSDVLTSALTAFGISEFGDGPSCNTSSSTSASDEDEDEDEPKDPRKIARKYQLELCEKALQENVIVYLGTGCGKTHIAVLLMYEMRDLLRKPRDNICVFLAPSVALVQQQARVIEQSIDFKVGCYTGGNKRLRTHKDWQKEIDQHEVLVMTPEILVRNLSHCFVKMDSIALLIFDECHHAQVKSNHPYAEIMRVFYKANVAKRPRIFGMTASPIVGKGASDIESLSRYINSLENLLNAKVYSVEDKDELNRYVASPTIRVYHYGSADRGSSSCYHDYYTKLKELKHQCMSTLDRKNDDHQSLQNTRRMLNRMHDNLLFCAENLGLYGVLHPCRILLSGDYSERNTLIDGDGNCSDVSLCDKYLTQASKIFASNSPGDEILSALPCLEILKEPWFSSKLLCLIGILSSFRRQSNMKCIVFVNRIVVARSLTYILQHLTILAYWKADFLVGVHSGLKSMSRKNMKEIVEKFRSGRLNLLVATKVGEEGLDIQTCCLVIRFDLPETVASFIQSRGRARMAQSEYAFLVDRSSQKELDLIESFKKDEVRMDVEIAVRTSEELFGSDENKIYKVDSSGASISSGYSISLLHHYCAKLKHDEFFDPKPKIYYFDDLDGIVCQITFPASAPIHQVASRPQLSMEAAKRDASLKAIEELHRLGALDDFLLCTKDDGYREDSSDCEDENLREELHEMLVPDALKEQWSCLDNVVLYLYYLELCPYPADRTYKEFGLFLKAPLPVDAERMNVDLHLARGRSVMTKLVPSSSVTFDKDEIVEAQNFQEMFLKVILDRSDFISDSVILGKNKQIESGAATFYLLLPVILKDGSNTVAVDWKIIRRCLASPIFRSPTIATPLEFNLLMVNGFKSKSEVENSLVYAIHRKTFYFITDINFDRRGNSPYKDHEPLTHEDYVRKTFEIQLKYPEQPLLRAKPLFSLRNLLHNRRQEDTESQELEEYFIDLPPELCELKIIGFSKDIGSSLSLLPSLMHRLENLLVAIQLKQRLSSAFPEGAGVHAQTILEALTTERCQERFSLERLEILGDAFLKFAVGRHLFLLYDMLDEGGLTQRRSNAVNNSNLVRLAIAKNLQAYIRDQSFEPSQFFALGRPCPNICDSEREGTIHSQLQDAAADQPKASIVRCSRGHHWLHKNTIADAVEALVGAFIVDSGFKGATAFLKWIGMEVDFEASQITNACIASNHYLPLSDCVDIDMLERKLGYRFCHKGLILQAFVHASYNKHGGGCYQRLEFLGDAVLDYLITSYLYSVYPMLNPGQLTDLRSLSVNNKSFAKVAIGLSFHKFLLYDSSSLSTVINDYAEFISTSAMRSTHEEPKFPKVLGDVLESSVGAILLDTGFDLNCIWKIVLSFLDPVLSFSSLQLNPVRDMQELSQSLNWNLEFPTVKKGLLYTAEVKVSGMNFSASASTTNPNKKEAIRMSAERLFADLKAQGYTARTKPLEEILKSCEKGEAKLIGFDETPIDVNDLGQNKQDSFNCGRQKNAEETDCRSPCIVPFRQFLPHSETNETSGDHVINVKTTGVTQQKSAKSRLYEVCTANSWRAPLFECDKEDGPGHSKMFSFKVVVTIEETSETVLECYGEPCPKKKAAAENAAAGVLWYLKQEGYVD